MYVSGEKGEAKYDKFNDNYRRQKHDQKTLPERMT